MSLSHPTRYRADIDGLRAVAVLAVMLFHARASILPGGFVGVDIFFVISGFLITQQIAAEAAAGRFSLVEFYRRRVRRIAPMLLTVTAATLAASLLLMTPEEARAVAKSALWSIASLANVYFWREIDTGYFAAATSELPLLHLWSLGVEEQFYLLWPLLAAAAVRRLRIGVLLAGTALLALVSFEASARALVVDPSLAYYMLPMRAGELLLGAGAGLASALTTWRLGERAAQVAAWSGLALLAFALLSIDRELPFPGWRALPPTLGTALLILAGEGRPNPIRPLEWRPARWLGRLSYSAYLWHWPLFALFRYAYGEPGLATAAAILLLTLGLSWLSFCWIEQPARRSSSPFATLALRQFALPALALAAPALVVIYAERLGVPVSSADYRARLEQTRAATRAAFTYDWICQRQRLAARDLADPRCVLGPAAADSARALAWGDSNASHYVPMLARIAERVGTRLRNVAVGSCPPVFADPAPYVEARRRDDCLASNALVRADAGRYPVVVIAAAWPSYRARSPRFASDFEATVRELVGGGSAVVLLGKAPDLAGYDRRCAEKALRIPFKQCPDVAQPLGTAVVEANAWLRALAARVPGVHYFDANRYLCPEGRCRSYGAGGEIVYFDGSHLTVGASAQLGDAVLAAEGVPASFGRLVVTAP